MKRCLILVPFFLAGAFPGVAGSETFMAGASRIDLTRYDFEVWVDLDGDRKYTPKDWLFDTGTDQRYDYEEPGAFGPDGKPGIAGVDDDGNGIIDDCARPSSPEESPRANCQEYLAGSWRRPSDDVKDPAGDNYHPIFNRKGTEGNGRYDGFGLAGFGPNFPLCCYRATNLIPENDYSGDGIGDGIWARALAVKKGETLVVHLVMDYAGMFHNYMNEVKRQVARPPEEGGLGIPEDAIIVSTTHNHNSPDAYGLWDMGDGGIDPDYIYGKFREVRPDDTGVEDRMFVAIRDAVANLRPALMRSNQGNHPGCLDQETLEVKADPDCRLSASERINFNPTGTPFDQFFNQNDLRDPWVRNTVVTVLQFVDAGDPSETIATVVNYSNHPEVLGSVAGTWESSDYVHFVREKLEAAFGGIAIFWLGTQGSQIGYLRGGTPVTRYDADGNPLCRKAPEAPDACIEDPNGVAVPEFIYDMTPEKVASMGYFIGDFAVSLVESAGPFLDDPPLEHLVRRITLEVTNPFQKVYFCYLIDDFQPQDFIRIEPGGDRKPRTFSACMARVNRPRARVFLDRIPLHAVTIGEAQYLTAPMETEPAYLLGREASHVEYPDFEDECDFPAMPGLIELMTGKHNFMVSMAESYFSYGFPESDFLGYVNPEHPNYYEDSVTLGREFGDTVANNLSEMLGGSPRRYPFTEPACNKVTAR